ncbi:hypothetical protein HDU85_004382 [Gaertneriomyces sp. JEL0708]|nr:hypothetical protein HDU85_004382 [Gaertneriomyces sp. JEL0708]
MTNEQISRGIDFRQQQPHVSAVSLSEPPAYTPSAPAQSPYPPSPLQAAYIAPSAYAPVAPSWPVSAAADGASLSAAIEVAVRREMQIKGLSAGAAAVNVKRQVEIAMEGVMNRYCPEHGLWRRGLQRRAIWRIAICLIFVIAFVLLFMKITGRLRRDD